MTSQLEVDRLREKFPRAYKALVQLYPAGWDGILRVIEPAMAEGKTASIIAGKLSILRGLERSTRRWVVLSIQADRREIMLGKQKSFLTLLHDRSLDDILAELKDLEAKQAEAGATPGPPNDNWPRGYVFISHHKSTEGALAQSLAASLEQQGAPCWVAPRDVRHGFNWNEEVYGAAQRCGALVFLYSEGAAKSRHVQGEIHIAVARGVPVFVVKLAPGDPAAINIGLATYQHVDWIGRSRSDLASLAKLLHADISRARAAETRAA